MSDQALNIEQESLPQKLNRYLRLAVLVFYIAVLAWTPFPLGSAPPWAQGSVSILIAIAALGNELSGEGFAARGSARLPSLIGPIVLGGAALTWAVVQILPNVVSPGWVHPFWGIASTMLGRSLPGTISLNPWSSLGEIVKLATAATAFWLAFSMSRREKYARILLNTTIVLGVLYAVYGFLLAVTKTSQASLVYTVPIHMSETSGPFMLHNTFATYCGLALVAALARLLHVADTSVVTNRGPRRAGLSIVQFLFGHGLMLFLSAIVLFGAVIASQSRAGLAATIAGCLAIAIVKALNQRQRLLAFIGVAATILPLFMIMLSGADALGRSYGELLDPGTADSLRPVLWRTTLKMIADAPLLGLGLGTLQDAYPIYATQPMPYVMDKAHCDYLELAAGLGLPAAFAWLSAILWLFFLCLRGAFVRRRNQLFAVAGVGASVVIAAHSAVDFSLQIPAVALSFSTLLGIGVAQSVRTQAV